MPKFILVKTQCKGLFCNEINIKPINPIRIIGK